jgi:hypothetical protein
VYRWFDPWLPIMMIVATPLVTVVLPWIAELFDDFDGQRR